MGSAFYILYFAVAGFVAGFGLGLAGGRFAPGGQFGHGLMYGLGAVLVTSAAAYTAARMGGDVPPEIGGSRIEMLVELKGPEGWKLSNRMRSAPGLLTLASVTGHGRQRNSTTGDMDLLEVRMEGGRSIIPGSVSVYTPKGRRVLRVELDGEKVAEFEAPLPPNPGEADLTWSHWMPASPQGFEFRFRVERRVDEQRAAAARKGALADGFQKLTPTSAIEGYLPYLDDPDWDVRNKTIIVVGKRVEELLPLLESEDRKKLGLALEAAARQSQLPASFQQPLLGVLRQILADLKSLRETSLTDPDARGAGELQRRFVAWSSCWRGSHASRTPVPQELLELIEEARKFDPKQLEQAHAIAELAQRYKGEWPR
jgi:hypothetical protein